MQPVIEETNPNDIATVVDNIVTTSKGVIIRCSGVSPMLLQKAQSKVKLPEDLMYTVELPGGKTQSFKWDEKVATEVEYGQQIWNTHQDKIREAMAQQNDNAVKAILLFGAEIIDWGKESNWERKFRIMGFDVPEDELEKSTFYLMNNISGDELTEIINKVMLQSGATEEDIKKAEATFRS